MDDVLEVNSKALEVFKKSEIISQIDANISYICEEIERRLEALNEKPEDPFVVLGPGTINELIKQGKIDEEEINKIIDELKKIFPKAKNRDGTLYYGVLLIIAIYAREESEKKQINNS